MDSSADKPEKSLSPSVAIDGEKIRAVRETKKLTQLYVANMVGVTTDTISRWENNRYPTIKRENADKLASALEVELAEILKTEAEEATSAEMPVAGESKWKRAGMLLIVVGLAIIGAAYFTFVVPVLHPAAVRKLPPFAAPGQIIPVQIKVSRTRSNREGFIIREKFPPGWRFVASLPSPAAWRENAEEAKWLIPAGNAPVTISYTVLVNPQAPLNTGAEFSGAMVAQAAGTGHTETIGGARSIKVAGIHWADTNGDGRIDDNEIMPAYYLTEEMKGLGLDWKTIEAIWSARGYTWDQSKKEFVVIK
ncbi:MAG TPA: helix-turn-helix transcriptional regulator [Geobacteraceae bacterium]|nr:helix-turn-helix transcriptional regulator [Geobacteraceae bacterium]